MSPPFGMDDDADSKMVMMMKALFWKSKTFSTVDIGKKTRDFTRNEQGRRGQIY